MECIVKQSVQEENMIYQWAPWIDYWIMEPSWPVSHWFVYLIGAHDACARRKADILNTILDFQFTNNTAW